MEFPKWKYHRTKSPVVVNNPEQEAALGEGWADHPNAFVGPPPAEPASESPAAEPEIPAAAEAPSPNGQEAPTPATEEPAAKKPPRAARKPPAKA